MAENQTSDEQIKELLKKNLAYTREIYEIQKKVKKYIFWGRIMSTISILLVLGPLILGVIYLPEILDATINKIIPGGLDNVSNLESLLGNGGQADQQGIMDLLNGQKGNLDPYQDIFKNYK